MCVYSSQVALDSREILTSNRFIFFFKDLRRWRVFTLLTMASSSAAFRFEWMEGEMRNQGRHPILLIMYYLSAAQSQKPANNFRISYSFSYIFCVLLGLAVGLCVVNVGIRVSFPRHCERNAPPTASYLCGVFFSSLTLRVIYSYS